MQNAIRGELESSTATACGPPIAVLYLCICEFGRLSGKLRFFYSFVVHSNALCSSVMTRGEVRI